MEGLVNQRKITRGICVVMLLVLCTALLGCGNHGTKEARTVDMDEFMEYSLSNIEFDDEITRIQDNMVSMIYALPKGACGRVAIGKGYAR